jgi:hypothetical protein
LCAPTHTHRRRGVSREGWGGDLFYFFVRFLAEEEEEACGLFILLSACFLSSWCVCDSLSRCQHSSQVRKLQERVQRAKEEVQRTKEKYEAALQEINSYNPKYMEDMQEVFDKCQQMEAQRLTFFKEVLFNIHKGLNISQDPT